VYRILVTDRGDAIALSFVCAYFSRLVALLVEAKVEFFADSREIIFHSHPPRPPPLLLLLLVA
jgi:hypothetical protein